MNNSKGYAVGILAVCVLTIVALSSPVESTFISVPPSGIAPYNAKTIAFLTPSASGSGSGSGSYFFGGYYEFGGSSNDMNPAITWGLTNSSYAAHVGFVTGAQPASDVTIDVTGIKVDDYTGATTGYTQTITIPSGTPVNTYYESVKFIGQVTIESTSGTDIPMNYLWAKYWDNQNSDFTLHGSEARWLGGANDAGFNIKIHHHQTTGWVYNAGGEPSHPDVIADMRSEQNNSGGVRNGIDGAWKHLALDTKIMGTEDEGIIVEVISTTNGAIDIGHITLYWATP